MTETKTGTKEWSDVSCNFQLGCKNGCRYCYAAGLLLKNGIVSSPKQWLLPVINENKVKQARRLLKYRDGTPKKIMFPTSHDITEENLGATIEVLLKLLKAGNQVLIVSKPRYSCIELLCKVLEPYKNQVEFRFSISCKYNKTINLWEPYAPTFEERFKCLQHTYNKGYETSISCEPLLVNSVKETEALIRLLSPYVSSSLWLGKLNRVKSILPHTCKDKPHLQKQLAREVDRLDSVQNYQFWHELYKKYNTNPLIKWKDSARSVLLA